jgi:hypothetical protein
MLLGLICQAVFSGSVVIVGMHKLDQVLGDVAIDHPDMLWGSLRDIDSTSAIVSENAHTLIPTGDLLVVATEHQTVCGEVGAVGREGTSEVSHYLGVSHFLFSPFLQPM